LAVSCFEEKWKKLAKCDGVYYNGSVKVWKIAAMCVKGNALAGPVPIVAFPVWRRERLVGGCLLHKKACPDTKRRII
jgi:hypothetical protein